VFSTGVPKPITTAFSDDRRQGATSDEVSLPLAGETIGDTGLVRPKRGMRFFDLISFYLVTGISLRWIATAASAGPSSVFIWFGAWLTFYTPLALSVIELSSRYPQQGGLYVWSKRASGDFGAFICAWIYWTSNLPYFPAVLYFAAGNIIYMRGKHWEYLASNPTFYIVFALVTLGVITLERIS